MVRYIYCVLSKGVTLFSLCLMCRISEQGLSGVYILLHFLDILYLFYLFVNILKHNLNMLPLWSIILYKPYLAIPLGMDCKLVSINSWPNSLDVRENNLKLKQ